MIIGRAWKSGTDATGKDGEFARWWVLRQGERLNGGFRVNLVMQEGPDGRDTAERDAHRLGGFLEQRFAPGAGATAAMFFACSFHEANLIP